MRTLLIATLLAAATAGAAAAPAVTPDATASSGMQVVVGPNASHRKLTPEEIKAVRGAYQLSNGAIMRISGEKNRLYAELSGMPRTEIVPTGENEFAAVDADMTMSFVVGVLDNDVTVSLPAKK